MKNVNVYIIFLTSKKRKINKILLQVQEKKIYALHDTPHILKNIRNTLTKHDIEYAEGKVCRLSM